jgi:YVTN family beta-propeller protein
MEHGINWTLTRIGKTALTFAAAAIGAAVLLGSSCNLTNKAPTVPVISGPSSGVVGVPVTFKATATDPEGDSIAFQFDWGDTSTQSWSNFIASGETASIQHTYSDSGTFSVKAKAKNKKGKETQYTVGNSIGVLSRGAGYPDSVSGFIAVPAGAQNIALSPNGHVLYVAGANRIVTVVDVPNRAVVREIRVGDQPLGLAVSPSGEFAYVANWGESTLSVIRADSWEVVATVPVVRHPRDVVVSIDGSKLYVTSSASSYLYVVNAGNYAIEESVAFSAPVLSVVLDAIGATAYVLDRNDTLSVLRLADYVVTGSIGCGPESRMAATPERDLLFLSGADSSVEVIRAPALTQEGSIVLPEQPLSSVGIAGGYLVLTGMMGIHFVYTTTLSVVGTLRPDSVQEYDPAIATPDGSRLYVATASGVYIVEKKP